MNLVQEYTNGHLKPAANVPKFNVGDTVRVHFRIVEGEKERVQVFEGVVIGRRNGEGANGVFTVRRVAFNEGVERVFPIHSPRVEKVEVTREGQVRRAKLYYLRDRQGKAARVKAKQRDTKKEAILKAEKNAVKSAAKAAKAAKAAEAKAAQD